MANQGDTFDITYLNFDEKAREISRLYMQWQTDRDVRQNELKDLRDYLYAGDTVTTQNRSNPFSNSTHIPKLEQLKNDLLANYIDTLFGNPEWLEWEAHESQSDLKEKANFITSYVRNKLEQQNADRTLSSCLLDWIITGDCIAELVYVNEGKEVEDPATGDKEVISTYTGPKIVRISPFDIVYNITATSWEAAPQIIRRFKSLGQLAKEIEQNPETATVSADILQKVLDNRISVRQGGRGKGAIDTPDEDKSEGFIADGFNSIQQYYNSELVEILEFQGDYYNKAENKLYQDYKIVVVDRTQVAAEGPIESWTKTKYTYKSSWSERPENLVGRGPLEGLVGMQYKIDKLENLRADIFDNIAYPTEIHTGEVDEFGQIGQPGRKLVIAEGGSADHLRPDATALNADFQIQQTMQLMDLMAGNPSASLGIRTPGEKTAFEIQTLDNGINKRFRTAVRRFERDFLEPLLDDFIEMAKRKMNGSELIRMTDETFGAERFQEITKSDLASKGKLRARGSSHFLRNSLAAQNISTLAQNPALLQMVSPHMSRIKMAKTLEDLLGIRKFDLVKENVGITEDAQTQRIISAAQQQQDLEEDSAPEVDDVVTGEDIDVE